MRRNKKILPKTSLKQKIILVIGGMLFCLVILELGLRLGRFIFSSCQEYHNKISIKQKGTYRIMCLGESTTAWQYPPYLKEVLNHSNMGVKFSVIDKGVPGVSTSGIVSRLEFYLDEYNPDMVITMMGINDNAMPGVITASKRLLFVQELRVYKFVRLLWLHIITKIKMAQLYRFMKKGENTLSVKRRINSYRNKLKEPLELGLFYVDEGKLLQAERLFRKTVGIDPGSEEPYVELGRIYLRQHNDQQAEELFKKAIGIDPGSEEPYVELGRIYLRQHSNELAQESFKKAIELNPFSQDPYAELVGLYLKRLNINEAEAWFKKAVEKNPGNESLLGALYILFKEIGYNDFLRQYDSKAMNMDLTYSNPTTVASYHKLKKILDCRKVKLVCVQYPMRSIEPLKKIFRAEGGVIFVDNEKVFKEALLTASHEEYFTDMFAGDFGHCTQKGNRLLAENIAKVILEEVSSK